MSREWYGGASKSISVRFLPDMEIQGIYSEGILEEEEENLYTDMELMVPILPTPFKPGDMVIDASNKECGPFVFESIDTRKVPDPRIQAGSLYECRCQGYGVADDGKIEYRPFPFYLDIEYYKEPLKGKYEILQPVSEAVKKTDNPEVIRCFDQFLKIYLKHRSRGNFY